MNQKRAYKCDWKPEFLYEVSVGSTGKKYTLTKGMWVSVSRRPGLIAGKYEFLYAERTGGVPREGRRPVRRALRGLLPLRPPLRSRHPDRGCVWRYGGPNEHSP